MPHVGPTGYSLQVNFTTPIDPASAVLVTKKDGDPVPLTVNAVGPTGFAINFPLPAGPVPICTFSYLVVPP